MLKRVFSFTGRISRKEYIMSYLLYLVIYSIITNIVEGAGIVVLIIGLAIVLIALRFIISQGVKRCHDIGHSGWYILIPFYGFWLMIANSQPERNQFGYKPR